MRKDRREFERVLRVENSEGEYKKGEGEKGKAKRERTVGKKEDEVESQRKWRGIREKRRRGIEQMREERG